MPTPTRMRLGIGIAVVASIALLALAVTVALIGGREPEVAGSFVLTFLAVLTPFPHVLAAAIPLLMVGVLARGSLSKA